MSRTSRRRVTIIGLVAVMGTVVLAVTAQASGDGVLAYRGGPGRTGVMPGPGPSGPPRIAWTVQAEAPIVALTAADGVVHAVAGNGVVLALDLVTGQERWAASIDADISAPSLVADGLLIVADEDGQVHALDLADGSPRWTAVLDSGITGAPAPSGDLVLVATLGGRLAALRTADGRVAWDVAVGGRVVRSVAVHGDTAFLGVEPGVVLAASVDDGSERWRHRMADDGVPMTPAVDEGSVFAALGATDQAMLQALDSATGAVRWALAPDTTSALYAPVVAPDAVLAGDAEGRVWRVDRSTGEVEWTVQTAASSLSIMSLAGDTLYALGDEGALEALDAADGSVLWQLPIGRGGGAPIVLEGFVVLGTSLGEVVAVTGDAG